MVARRSQVLTGLRTANAEAAIVASAAQARIRPTRVGRDAATCGIVGTMTGAFLDDRSTPRMCASTSAHPSAERRTKSSSALRRSSQ